MKTAPVLVTGGTGFVGSHLLAALAQRGIPVRALVRSPAKASALALDGVEWIAGSLDEPAGLARAAAGVGVIYHLAGLVAARSEAEFLATNHGGTARLLAAAERTGARFVLVSSLAAGGPAEPGRPARGDEPARPVTAYGRSKLAAERAVRSGPLPWVILRPPSVYGPRDREFLRLFRAVSRFGVAPVFGDGTQELSVVFGPDLAEAIVAAGTSPAAVGHVLHPAHPEILTAAALVRGIAAAGGRRASVVGIPRALARSLLAFTGAAARLSGRATILTPDKGNEFFQPAWTCDPAPLTTATGWEARHDLAAGAAITFAWYRAEGWL